MNAFFHLINSGTTSGKFLVLAIEKEGTAGKYATSNCIDVGM